MRMRESRLRRIIREEARRVSARVDESAGDLVDYITGLGVHIDEAEELIELIGSFGLQEGLATWIDDYGQYYPIIRRKRPHIEALARAADL